ncbi:MAG TPA: glycosyltransferase family 9 protein [Bacteroidota bacterium]|nr:glycosyltransferase family 9 protein [Bacteroidota bacterium]
MSERILIIRPDRIGDVVLTTPLIRSVRESFPDSFIAVMVHPSNTPLLEGNPRIDRILTDDPTGVDSGRRGFWKQVERLRDYRFDTGLMPFPRERHAWMMFLSGIKKRVGVGHKLYQMLTFTRYVERHKYVPLRHESEYMLDLAAKIGAMSIVRTPELFLSQEEKEAARRYLVAMGAKEGLPTVGTNPFSRSSSPNWRFERYSALIESLLGDFNVVINLGPHESGQRPRLAHLEDKGAIVLQQSLREHMATVSQMDVLVSSSTGSMHIAAALGIPTVSLFCPLTACSPMLWGPVGNRSAVLLPSPGYCQTRCPGDPKVCPLEDIEVDRVLKEIQGLVGGRNQNA